jgi:hypothetical protein
VRLIGSISRRPGTLRWVSKKKNRVMKKEPGFRRKVEEKTDFRSSLKPGFIWKTGVLIFHQTPGFQKETGGQPSLKLIFRK